MTGLDQSDIEIIRLLKEDCRRPYSEIANKVGLSAPTVSDRIERLENAGVINKMTLDLDRDQLENWTPLIVQLSPVSRDPATIEEELTELEFTQSVFRTAEGDLLVRMRGPVDTVRTILREDLGIQSHEIEDVSIVTSSRTANHIPEGILDEEPKHSLNAR